MFAKGKFWKVFTIVVVLIIAVGVIAWRLSRQGTENNRVADVTVGTAPAIPVVPLPPSFPSSSISKPVLTSTTLKIATSTPTGTTHAAPPPAPVSAPKITDMATSVPSTVSVAAATSIATTPITSDNDTPVAITINEAPNVALLCHYKINDPELRAAYAYAEDSDGELLAKGSGVIVDPEGYILTAKHMVDPQWENIAYASSIDSDDVQLNDALSLDYCDVGMPQNQAVPATSILESLNPSIAIENPFPYVATLAFDPPQGQMSHNEFYDLDFALLKISGPMEECQTFNLCTLPSSFPYSPVFYNSTPDLSTAPKVLIDFGYPAESINSYGGAFTDFYLKGTVGHLTDYQYGDQYFENAPLTFAWQASDVLPGRSGSPIYWQGYVIGIEVSGEVDNSTMDNAVAMPAIAKVLAADGLGNILMTR